jgi:hypothetical protein
MTKMTDSDSEVSVTMWHLTRVAMPGPAANGENNISRYGRPCCAAGFQTGPLSVQDQSRLAKLAANPGMVRKAVVSGSEVISRDAKARGFYRA